MNKEKITPEIAAKWFKSKEWSKGLNLNAHFSTDMLEFCSQYAKNKNIWNKAFEYLKNTDILNMQAGKYKIEGNELFAIIAEGHVKDIENTKWEAHKKYVDIQYVVRGKEKMGIAPISKAIGIDPFDETNDIGFYNVPEADCKYYTAEPGTFFIFFPNDAHRPAIKTNSNESVKKIVLKIKVS